MLLLNKKAQLFRANVTSPIVNGDTVVAVVPSTWNSPCDSNMIAGEDYGEPAIWFFKSF